MSKDTHCEHLIVQSPTTPAHDTNRNSGRNTETLLFVHFALILLLLPSLASAGNDPPSGSLYLAGDPDRPGLVLAHGRGTHPDWKVVGPLRRVANRALGYHTLSLQLPNPDKHWSSYLDTFPSAYQRIGEGIRFLRARGVEHIYLMGHSMGARMMSAYLARHDAGSVVGIIVAGCRNNGPEPMACASNLASLNVPVLDIWPEDNPLDSAAGAARIGLVSDRYRQVEITSRDHQFDGRIDEFLEATVGWLKAQP
ncbi:MAG: alpha/beta fold hydrolase [Pseudomonadota bacterium]